jgi:signal transduction histidine kinase
MDLAAFIGNNKDKIADEWIKHAQDNISPTGLMEKEEVRDHIVKMLERIVEDMATSQSIYEQEEKSKGNKKGTSRQNKAARDHGEQRLEFGFNFLQLSSEFRALRASVLRLWANESREENWEVDFHDMVRFNEAIDEAWTVSVKRYQKKLDQGRDMFLSVLGHDLRNPIATISGVNSILELSENLSEKEKVAVQYSKSGTKRMAELIDNLLELTRLHLGKGMTVNKAQVDLQKHAHKIVQELQLAYPKYKIKMDSVDSVEGEWDKLRLEQMITNLVSNAIRHGEPGGTIKVHTSKEGNSGVLSVHNTGAPIPEKYRKRIFQGRFSRRNGNAAKEKSYGLGLYIVKEIVVAHQGKIMLTSSEEQGTTFKIILPIEAEADNISASVAV